MLFLARLKSMIQLELRLVRGQESIEIFLNQRGEVLENVLFGVPRTPRYIRHWIVLGVVAALLLFYHPVGHPVIMSVLTIILSMLYYSIIL